MTRERRAKQLGILVNQLPDNRGKHGRHCRGRKHYRWTWGPIISTGGYTKIRVGKSHPLADSNGYAYEHLVVWVSAGRLRPKRGELIHHTGNKRDNRIEKLELKTRASHNSLHNAERGRDFSGRFNPRAGRLLDGREWNEFPEVHP